MRNDPHPSSNRPARVLCMLALCGMALVAPPAAARTALPSAVGPTPELQPQEVVRIQLEALRASVDNDDGFAVAFRFASPENKKSTGPLARFATMIKTGPYALMLRFTDAVYAPVQVRGRLAVQDVTLLSPGVAPVSYRFHLSRQESDGLLNDCWMTDAVQVLPTRGAQV